MTFLPAKTTGWHLLSYLLSALYPLSWKAKFPNFYRSKFLLKIYNCVHISIMSCHLDIRISNSNKHKLENSELCMWKASLSVMWMMWNETVSYNPWHCPAKWPLITHHICHPNPASTAAGHSVTLTSNKGQKQNMK